MIIWSIFLTFALILTALSLDKNLSEHSRKFYQLSLILLLIWFSGFRDGLGQDYEGYYENLKNGANLSFTTNEPLFSLFANIVYYTSFSSQFFFLVMAIITNTLLINSFYRYNNTFIIIFIFLTCVIFYFNTFNLVRQMCAASIFVYSVRYIENKQIFKYLVLILAAISIHASAIFLVPVYFIINRNIPKNVILFILILSIYIGQIKQINLLPLLSKYIPLYSYYLDEGKLITTSSGFLTLFFNLCLILLLFCKKIISSDIKNNIAFNLFFIGVILYNLIPSFFYIFRFAIYFIIFAPIILPSLKYVISKQLSLILLITCFGLMFGNYIYKNLDNKKVIPDKILPISSIFDE